MLHEKLLRLQIEEAVQCPRARYLITAIIDGTEHVAGETIIGPHSDIEASNLAILALASAALRRQSIYPVRWDLVQIVIEDGPLLY